jgi:hypothetical protein
VREAAALAAGHAELEQLEEDITRATRDQNAAVVAMAACSPALSAFFISGSATRGTI